jgi:hypothetical protein
MELRKQIGRFFVFVFIFVFVLGALLFIGIGGPARGTAPPIIESVGPSLPQINNHELRIATVNLEGVSVLGFDWSDDIDERFAAMAERLGTNVPLLDVVLIQEAWKNVARRGLLAHEGVVRNFPYRVDVAEQPGGAGLVILSRLPIKKAHFHRFQAQGQCLKIWEGDCISGKGILTVQFILGDRSVWIGNTHLIACYTRPGELKNVCDKQDPNGSYRWDQILEARQVIEGLVGEDTAIFGGDFNFTRTSRYYPLMTSPAIPSDSSKPPSLSLANDKLRGWTESNGGIVAPNGLDYFWTRPGSELRWHTQENIYPIFTRPVILRSGKRVPLSDHPVLMTTFCLVRVGDPDNRCLSTDGKNNKQVSLSSG